MSINGLPDPSAKIPDDQQAEADEKHANEQLLVICAQLETYVLDAYINFHSVYMCLRRQFLISVLGYKKNPRSRTQTCPILSAAYQLQSLSPFWVFRVARRMGCGTLGKRAPTHYAC